MSIKVFNLLDIEEKYGEDATNALLSTFVCTENKDIENFVRNNALTFAKQKISMTYLVVSESESDAAFSGIFTIMVKPISFSAEAIQTTAKRKYLSKFSSIEDEGNTMVLSSFLIAQIGRDSRVTREELPGYDLLDKAISVIRRAQKIIGGGVVYLECDSSKYGLLDFYQRDDIGFVKLDERSSVGDKVTYARLFKLLKDKKAEE